MLPTGFSSSCITYRARAASAYRHASRNEYKNNGPPHRSHDKETVLARDAPSKLFQFVREQLKVGWMEYLESLGVHDHGSHSIRRWSKETVMSEIRRCHSEAQPLNSAAIVQVDQSLLSTPASFSAREAAGV